MKVALICTNLFNIDEKNRTGSGIFNHILIRNLARYGKRKDFTVYASGESAVLPLKVESVSREPSSADPKIIKNGKHVMFELALISKAFEAQDRFDLFHVNIGDGDLVLPFASFVKKPILITLHNIVDEDFTRKYFALFKRRKNVFFVSASGYQRKLLPGLNYLETIYHGVEIGEFSFDPRGGEDIMWAGRFIPGKGPDLVIRLAKRTGRKAKLFGVIKDGFEDWFEREVRGKIGAARRPSISLHVNFERHRLIKYFQKSKLFLSPVSLEEAFGLVFAEAMACGTPVVTFARGSAPEIIKDGQTGFLVNPSDDDIRGDWIVKKTGFEGLCEAVERIYAMGEEEYLRMRERCRKHAEDNFSAETMSKKYLEAYKKLAGPDR